MEHGQAAAAEDADGLWLVHPSNPIKKVAFKVVSKSEEAKQTGKVKSILGSSPSGGEPDQPRGCFHLQRRQTKSSTGANTTRARNTNRGLRSFSSNNNRILTRQNRRRSNRRQFRQFKAPERHLRQCKNQHAFSKSAMLDRSARKSLFQEFKNPNQTDKTKKDFQTQI